MIRIETSVVINRPIEEVFAFVTDFDKLPQWQSGVLEGKQTSESPMGVGTTGREVRQLLGRRMETTVEVTDYEPNKTYNVKATAGPIPYEARHTFESVEGGTKVTLVVEGEPGDFFKMAEPLVARMLKRQFEANFANLKDLLEAQAQGSA